MIFTVRDMTTRHIERLIIGRDRLGVGVLNETIQIVLADLHVKVIELLVGEPSVLKDLDNVFVSTILTQYITCMCFFKDFISLQSPIRLKQFACEHLTLSVSEIRRLLGR